MSNTIIPGILSKIFGADKLVDSIGNGLDKLITNKEELAKVKLEVEKEVNRHLEERSRQESDLTKAYLADTDSARNREIETTRAGSANIVQASLAFVGVAVCLAVFSYMLIAKNLKEMESEESFIMGSLIGLLGAILKDIYGYYFGSSSGSASKDITIKKLQK